jgi:hypothetical protein
MIYQKWSLIVCRQICSYGAAEAQNSQQNQRHLTTRKISMAGRFGVWKCEVFSIAARLLRSSLREL